VDGGEQKSKEQKGEEQKAVLQQSFGRKCSGINAVIAFSLSDFMFSTVRMETATYASSTHPRDSLYHPTILDLDYIFSSLASPFWFISVRHLACDLQTGIFQTLNAIDDPEKPQPLWY